MAARAAIGLGGKCRDSMFNRVDDDLCPLPPSLLQSVLQGQLIPSKFLFLTSSSSQSLSIAISFSCSVIYLPSFPLSLPTLPFLPSPLSLPSLPLLSLPPLSPLPPSPFLSFLPLSPSLSPLLFLPPNSSSHRSRAAPSDARHDS